MTRADTTQTKIHYKGNEDDFIILVESADAVKQWKEDKSTPLVDVVKSFDVFTTHKHGAQGELNRASNALLENEFGTKNVDDVLKIVIEKGQLQEVQGAARQADRNHANAAGAGVQV
jgi:ribosome maturation protein Sdo1